MTKAPQHTGFASSELNRLLAQIATPDKHYQLITPNLSFDLQLSQWLGWTDAVALAAALEIGVAEGLAQQGDATEALRGECARVRAAFVNAISKCSEPPTGRQRSQAAKRAGIAQDENAADFPPHKQHVQQQQRAMELAVSGLRARLRVALARCTPEMARLAAVDAVMEQALLPQTQRLTGSVLVLLERHFRRLQESQSDVLARLTPPQYWLDAYKKDQRAVLLAELDFRFQPIEGLMAALSSTPQAAKAAVLEPI